MRSRASTAHRSSRTLRLILILGVCSAVALADDGGTARHLLAGVRAFKDARYEEALVELRVVARATDAPSDLAFYLGPTLYKLGRYREALAVFEQSKAPADALTELYRGETCYRLQLFRTARAVFASLRTRGLGPVLDQAAERYVSTIDAAYLKPPEVATLDFYIDQGLAAGDPVIMAAYLDEARQVEALSPAHHRHAELIAGLAAAWNASGRARMVVDVLAPEAASSPEATWQLARAYVELGDSAHARPLLQSIARGGGPHAGAAAALAANLPP